MELKIWEAPPDDAVLELLMAFSRDWEREQSCHGYRQNTRQDIEGNRIFLAEADGRVVGYLFGAVEVEERGNSVLAANTLYFEVEELYIRPEWRSRGLGRRLFQALEQTLQKESVEFVLLSTATKNYRAILHFYLDELDMTFWNARLFKKLEKA